jgi:hypothetical protein
MIGTRRYYIKRQPIDKSVRPAALRCAGNKRRPTVMASVDQIPGFMPVIMMPVSQRTARYRQPVFIWLRTIRDILA